MNYPLSLALLLICLCQGLHAGERFRVATYNIENFLQSATDKRPAKSAPGQEKVLETLSLLKADVLALQEVGGPVELRLLREGLKARGHDYLYCELVGAADTNIHQAILSRFPITARQPHTNLTFVLFGRQFQVSRGFAEVQIQVNTNYSFTLISAHLKSRREMWEADEADFRQQEALLLRGIVDEKLKSNPEINLVVLGDFNDIQSSRPIRTLLGRGRLALVDPRPFERNGDAPPQDHSRVAVRTIAWTYFYDRDDTYSRVDYILLSRGMERERLAEETFVPAIANWGVGSDHRPVVAGFVAQDQ